jgi:hypothetical protein
MTKHGHCKNGKWTPMYRVWRAMIQRCRDKNSINYERYGARGIRIEWKSFEDFVHDMESGWSPGLQIERKDNSGPYRRENCRWATPKEQALNRRNNVWLEHDGQRKTLSQWADGLGMKRMTLKRRLNLGWSVSDALTTPIRK